MIVTRDFAQCRLTGEFAAAVLSHDGAACLRVANRTRRRNIWVGNRLSPWVVDRSGHVYLNSVHHPQFNKNARMHTPREHDETRTRPNTCNLTAIKHKTDD